MTEKHTLNTDGRERNDAQPLGKTPGLKTEEGMAKTAKRSRKSAGPDGPSAEEVGQTFKS